jgi:AcrR family transcriptional regulator
VSTITRKPAAVRREEIVQAVLHIIGEHGLTSLTTSNLAAEVGLTTGALFRHFASQEEILREATRHAVARIETTFPDESLAPLERLLALARNRVRVLGADAGLAWFLRSEQAALALPEDAAFLLRDLVTRSKKYLLVTLREGVADGSIRGDIDPEVLLVPVLGTVHTLIGMSGVPQASSGRRPGVERVLEGLIRLLSPPERGDSKRAPKARQSKNPSKIKPKPSRR